VLNSLSIPDDDIQVARHGINMLYMRFLSRFEQNETGNDNDADDSDLHSSRSRLKMLSSFVNSESPVSVARGAAQSTVLQQQWSTASNFDKLLKSLLSGMPNEVDFAMNVLTLLSHPGPYSLKFNEVHHSSLISALVAHCCMFSDGMCILCFLTTGFKEPVSGPSSLEDLHFDAWRKQSGHNFADFWKQSGIEDEEILSLLSPQLGELSSGSSLFADDKLELKNSVNWRVFQVLSIFRNLSFDQANRRPMASNLSLLK